VLLCCDLLSVNLDGSDGSLLILVVSLRIASASGLPICVVSLTQRTVHPLKLGVIQAPQAQRLLLFWAQQHSCCSPDLEMYATLLHVYFSVQISHSWVYCINASRVSVSIPFRSPVCAIVPAFGEKMRHVSPLSCVGRNRPQQRWGFIFPVVYFHEYQSNFSLKKVKSSSTWRSFWIEL
jgi:hypothetical protein